MNYLAHAYLSGDQGELQIGGLLGDFVKGPLENFQPQLPPSFNRKALLFGIQHHRALDAFSDQHDSLRQCVALLGPRFKRSGGIIIDVLFDHFLAKHWSRYCVIDLDSFSQSLYHNLQQYSGGPETFQRFSQRCREVHLFSRYRDLSTVDIALQRISERLRKPALLSGAFASVEKSYEELEREFHPSFAQLQHWAGQALDSAGCPYTLWRQ